MWSLLLSAGETLPACPRHHLLPLRHLLHQPGPGLQHSARPQARPQEPRRECWEGGAESDEQLQQTQAEVRGGAQPGQLRGRAVLPGLRPTGVPALQSGGDGTLFVMNLFDWSLQAELVGNVTPSAKTDNNGNVKPSVTFHTVLDRPSAAAGDKKTEGGKYKKSGVVQSWRNIFLLGQERGKRGAQELRGSHREINIDEAILPENKPLNYRPRPRSEINLSYSIQVGRDNYWAGVML